MSTSRCQEISIQYQRTRRSIKLLAADYHITQAMVRRALRTCGVNIASERAVAYKCPHCGRRYEQAWCAVCKKFDGTPCGLRTRPSEGHEPAVQEYAQVRGSSFVAWCGTK